MPVVAIAGGTSPGLGRAITVAILEQYHEGNAWTPIILSRSAKRPLWLRAIDPSGNRVPVTAVDYTSEASLTEALQGVHTLISVVLAKDGSQASQQCRLARAAATAGVKRFAPSDWADGPQGPKMVKMLALLREGVWEECDRLELETGMQWARFSNGCFLDYLGIGRFDAEEQKAWSEEKWLGKLAEGGGYAAGDDEVCGSCDKEGDMPDGSGAFLYSLGNASAELIVKEDGSPVTAAFTAIRDVGRFVAASLELAEWERDMTMSGDVIDTNQLLDLAERATGKRFQVDILTPNKIQQQIAALSEGDFMKELWLELKLMYAEDEVWQGLFDPVLNKKCPDVKPMTVRQYLEEYWHLQ